MDVNAVLKMVMDALAVASAPAGVAILLSIGLTQVVKAFDHSVWRDLKKGEVWAVSWLMTVVLFPFICWIMIGKQGARDNFALGLIAGVAAPIVVALLKKIGVDLDDYIGGRDDEPPADSGGAPVA